MPIAVDLCPLANHADQCLTEHLRLIYCQTAVNRVQNHLAWNDKANTEISAISIKQFSTFGTDMCANPIQVWVAFV